MRILNKENTRDQFASRGLSIKRNFSWMLCGNIFYAGCQWAMLVIIAKVGNPEMVGRFVLGLAVSAPVIMFSNLNLRIVYATDPKEHNPFCLNLALRLVTAPFAVLVIVGITIFARYPAETAFVVIGIGIAKAFEATSEIYYGLFQLNERLDRIAKSMFFKGTLTLLLLGTGVYLTKKIIYGVIGMAAAMALTLFTYDLKSAHFVLRQKIGSDLNLVRARLRPCWNISHLWKLAIFTLPLGVMILLQSLNTNIPRYFIEHNFGEHDLGIFAALSYVMVAGTTIVRALGQAVSPVMAKYYVAGKLKRFFRFIALLIAVGTGIGLAGVGIAALAGRIILRVIYTPEYSNYGSLFVCLMFAALFLFNAQFLDYGATIVRNFRAQMALSIIVSGVTLSLSIWLIPKSGLFGASQAILWGAVTKVIGNLAIIGIMANNLKKKKSLEMISNNTE